ncbi:hypothetical protein BC567DRAFT_267599 [Phyllosticta citribraziliensis]
MSANTGRGQNRTFTIQEQGVLVKAHELVAIYNARRPENLSTLDSGRNIPHIRRSLALFDPNGVYRSATYDKRSPEALNVRHHSQRASEVRRALESMEPATRGAGSGHGGADDEGADVGGTGCLELLALVLLCFLAFVVIAFLFNLKAASREQEEEDRYREMRRFPY